MEISRAECCPEGASQSSLRLRGVRGFLHGAALEGP